MRTLLAIGVACLVVGCSRAPEPFADKAEPAQATAPEQLVEVTGGWYSVNPELSMLCAGPTKEQVAATRKEHGPHGAEMIQVFMNRRAKAALDAGKTYPAGSIIEKRKSGGAVGKMVKRDPGFAELYGDWEFFYQEAKGKEEKMPDRSCADCHSTTRKTDHVFATWRPR